MSGTLDSPISSAAPYKHLDLAKSQGEVQNLAISTQANSMQKYPSTSTFDFMRSNSFFSSFMSSSRATKKLRTKSISPAPKVSIHALIKKKADKYYDPSLAGSVDDLLESGYTMVLNRKNQIQGYKAEEEELTEQCAQLELEILPEVNRFNVLRDEILGLREQQATFIEQNERVNREITKVNEATELRKQEICQHQAQLIDVIKRIESEIQAEKAQILDNREIHKEEIKELKHELLLAKDEKASLKDQIQTLKGQHEKLKNSQVDKRRKLENKSRMFLGLLKH